MTTVLQEVSMSEIRCSVTISALDSNSWSEILEARVDEWSSYAVFPEDLLRRLGIKRERQQEFKRSDGSRVLMWTGHARVTIEGQTGPATVVFGDSDTTPTVSRITLSGVSLKADPVESRLVYKLPRIKPPGWYEEQRLPREWVEHIEAERRGGSTSSRGG